MRGSTAQSVAVAPETFTATMSAQSSQVSLPLHSPLPTPALATTRSSPPSTSSAAWIAATVASGSVTSIACTDAEPPSASISSASDRSASSRRAARATVMP